MSSITLQYFLDANLSFPACEKKFLIFRVVNSMGAPSKTFIYLLLLLFIFFLTKSKPKTQFPTFMTKYYFYNLAMASKTMRRKTSAAIALTYNYQCLIVTRFNEKRSFYNFKLQIRLLYLYHIRVSLCLLTFSTVFMPL